MDKLCAKFDNEFDYDDTDYYVKGYNLNYSTASSSTSCGSAVISKIFEKSISPDCQSSAKNSTGSLTKPSSHVKETLVTPADVRDRCRVAFECRNNMICIEGNRRSCNKKK